MQDNSPSAEPMLFPFAFGEQTAAFDPKLMGIKGANLVEMAQLGLPVPPGFVLNTVLGQRIATGQDALESEIRDLIRQTIGELESHMNRQFGRGPSPLLLSVRSGAAVSMPGMMDTVLNLGLNSQTVEALAVQTDDVRFAWDSYRRFVQSYAMVVLDLDGAEFEEVLDEFRLRENVETDAELAASVLQEVCILFLDLVEQVTGEPFPQDVYDQLDLALLAVFNSWNTPRARRYRDLYSIEHDGGTAAVIQTMVFGNRNAQSCTGVYFTRNPSTGEAKPYGEYMPNAQGDEIVSGIRTPMELTEAAGKAAMSENQSFEESMPEIYADLLAAGQVLEHHFSDMQEIEFTVESEKLYLLQTRSGKRTPRAGLKIAVDMVSDGLVTKDQAVNSCDMAALESMLVATVKPAPGTPYIAKGLPASPGVATGGIVFAADDAVAKSQAGESCILLRPETDPRDVHGMHAANGILTARGGMTSHAAVVARGMGKPCITAAMTLKIDMANSVCIAAGLELGVGDVITIDGSAGTVYLGEQPISKPEPDGDLALLLKWHSDLVTRGASHL